MMSRTPNDAKTQLIFQDTTQKFWDSELFEEFMALHFLTLYILHSSIRYSILYYIIIHTDIHIPYTYYIAHYYYILHTTYYILSTDRLYIYWHIWIYVFVAIRRCKLRKSTETCWCKHASRKIRQHTDCCFHLWVDVDFKNDHTIDPTLGSQGGPWALGYLGSHGAHQMPQDRFWFQFGTPNDSKMDRSDPNVSKMTPAWSQIAPKATNIAPLGSQEPPWPWALGGPRVSQEAPISILTPTGYPNWPKSRWKRIPNWKSNIKVIKASMPPKKRKSAALAIGGAIRYITLVT